MSNQFLKNILIRLYQSKLGKKIWVCSVKFSRRPFIRRAVTRFIQDAGITNNNINNANGSLPGNSLNFKQKHHALVVFPWAGKNASYEYVKMMARALKELGFVVHALQYSDLISINHEDCFDFVYGIKTNNPNFGNYAVHPDLLPYENNEIDDWIDHDLLTSIEQLDSFYHFDFCLCNYLYLSSIFSRTPQAVKILLTHDDFERRNQKLHDAKIGADNYNFSCSKDEQIKAFNRADYIFAIQENEGRKFESYGLPKKVCVAPYVPVIRKFKSTLGKSNRLRVGYLASGHYPNIVAIERFINYLFIDQAAVDLYIGGSICNHLKPPQNKHIHLLGTFEDVCDFYKQCDVVVNPDTINSGIKIKSIEAMGHGLPLICTVAASKGMETNYPWHLCRDEADCADWILKLSKDQDCIDKIRKSSTEIFAKFTKKYSAYHLIRDIYNSKEKERHSSISLIQNVTSPAISVIIPTYNVERYFEQALLSVLNQSLTNIEVIPIDNGSRDRCGQIMDDYARQDCRIKPIHKIDNVGYGAAVNLGLKAAQGQYVAILEPDDWYEPEMLKTLYEQANNASVVKAGFYKHFDSGHVAPINLFALFSRITTVDKTISVPSFEPKLVVGESSIWSAIYKREFLIQNDLWMMETPGASYQDSVWKFMVYMCSGSVTLLDENFYHYRYLTPTSSSRSGKNPEIMFKNYEFLSNYLKKRSAFDDWKGVMYTHAFLDLVFHRNRLAEQYLPIFKRLASQFISQAERDGCSLDQLCKSESLKDLIYSDVIETYKWIKSEPEA